MMRTWIGRLAFISVTITLAACADHRKWHMHGADELPEEQLSESRFYINGNPVPLSGEEIIKIRKNKNQLNKLIDDLINVEESAEQIPNRNIQLELVSSIFDNNRAMEKGFHREKIDPRILKRVRGIGGFQTRILLHYFLSCSFDELKALEELKVVGKIKKWIYDQEAERVNFEYNGKIKIDKDAEKGSGFVFWQAEAQDCNGIIHDYKFHIAVDSSYELWKNLIDKGPKMKFGEPVDSMIPQEERDRNIVDDRRFDYKLHATGTNIHVLTVFLDNELVDKSDEIYMSDEKSCIDVFFKGDPPATELPDQVGYCMGRCDHPPVINTNGD